METKAFIDLEPGSALESNAFIKPCTASFSMMPIRRPDVSFVTEVARAQRNISLPATQHASLFIWPS